MKKRVVSLGLAAMMAMSMTACGGSGNAGTSESAAEDAQGAEGADGEVFKIGASDRSPARLALTARL